MKKIAIDLDGVIFDSENLYRVYTEIYDTDIKKQDNIVDNKQVKFQKRYNWKKEESDHFYKENANKILKDSNIMTGAELVLKKLQNNFEIIIVTARNDEETKIAKEKLEKINLGKIKIFHNEHEKINKFIEEKVNYIIEDDENICIKASNYGICALYFKNNACEKLEKENIININNWGEIYKYLTLKSK